jgi:hypothetical protein
MMKFLPPYSPMLNPIREVIGDIKREIRMSLSGELHDQALHIQSLRWGEKTHARRELLKTALERAFEQVTVHMADSHFAYSYSFLVRVVKGEFLSRIVFLSIQRLTD